MDGKARLRQRVLDEHEPGAPIGWGCGSSNRGRRRVCGRFDDLRRLLGTGFRVANMSRPTTEPGTGTGDGGTARGFISKVHVRSEIGWCEWASQSYRSGAVRDAGLVIVSVGGRALQSSLPGLPGGR